MTTITRLTTRTVLGMAALLLAHAAPSSAQEIDGDWRGAIDVMGQTLPFVAHFTTSDGVLGATMDIQGATGVVLQNVSYKAPTVHFELEGDAGLAVWEGKVNGDSVGGTFTQAGINGTFTMARTKAEDPGQAPTNQSADLPVRRSNPDPLVFNGDHRS